MDPSWWNQYGDIQSRVDFKQAFENYCFCHNQNGFKANSVGTYYWVLFLWMKLLECKPCHLRVQVASPLCTGCMDSFTF